jgi:hypothetical protein
MVGGAKRVLRSNWNFPMRKPFCHREIEQMGDKDQLEKAMFISVVNVE